jgi:hypothetical protein
VQPDKRRAIFETIKALQSLGRISQIYRPVVDILVDIIQIPREKVVFLPGGKHLMDRRAVSLFDP